MKKSELLGKLPSSFTKSAVDLKKTGLKIKELRKQNNFSVRQLQYYFKFTTTQAIYAWERGESVPTIDNLLLLANIFNVNITDILVTQDEKIFYTYEDKLAI